MCRAQCQAGGGEGRDAGQQDHARGSLQGSAQPPWALATAHAIPEGASESLMLHPLPSLGSKPSILAPFPRNPLPKSTSSERRKVLPHSALTSSHCGFGPRSQAERSVLSPSPALPAPAPASCPPPHLCPSPPKGTMARLQGSRTFQNTLQREIRT